MLAAVAYAGLKLQWAFGGTFGVPDPPPWRDPPQDSSWAKVADDPVLHFLAFEGTALLALCAAALIVVLSRGWGGPRLRRLLCLAAWVGCLALAVVSIAGFGGMAADAVGLLPTDPERYEVISVFVGVCFAALSLAFGSAARRDRGAPRR